MKKHRFATLLVASMVKFASMVTYLTAFMALYYGINPAIRKRKTVRYPLLPDCAACPSSPIIETL